jgi:hypothetical protein
MKKKQSADRSQTPGLARYERELPPALEIAKLAALLANVQTHRAAIEDSIRQAVGLYLETAEFVADYQKKDAKERALMVGDISAVLKAEMEKVAGRDSRPSEVSVPPLTKVPAKLDDFLARVVKAKTPADAAKRFRDFLKDRASLELDKRANPLFLSVDRPLGTDADTLVEKQIKYLKNEGFTAEHPGVWERLGAAYLAWRMNKIAERNRDNRLGKVKKQQATP